VELPLTTLKLHNLYNLISLKSEDETTSKLEFEQLPLTICKVVAYAVIGNLQQELTARRILNSGEVNSLSLECLA
jgi:hypothetical protein